MYTDPGSGLFFVQMLGAAIATISFRFRRKIAVLIRPRRDEQSERDI